MPGFISIIAAIGEHNCVIGRDNDLPWSKKLKPDMQRFKQLTLGKPVIMGRLTFESLPPQFRPLPDRHNIVVTGNPDLAIPGVETVRSIPEALERAARFGTEIMVIGGAEIYARTLGHASRLYLTLVDEDAQGDRFFPASYRNLFTRQTERVVVPDFEPRLTFLTLERG